MVIDQFNKRNECILVNGVKSAMMFSDNLQVVCCLYIELSYELLEQLIHDFISDLVSIQ